MDITDNIDEFIPEFPDENLESEEGETETLERVDLEEDEGKLFIEFGIEAIQNDDPEEFQTILDKLPLDILESSESTELFEQFASQIAEYGRSKMVPVLLNAWEAVYPLGNQITLFSSLFLTPLINIPTLQFFAKTKEDTTYMEIMQELVEYDGNDDLLQLACVRAIKVYGEQDPYVYQLLLKYADQEDNTKVFNFMVKKIEKINNYAPIPKWVKSKVLKESEVKIPEYQLEPVDLPNIEEIATRLIIGLEQNEIFIKEKYFEVLKQGLMTQLRILPPIERAKIMEPIIKIEQFQQLQSNIDLFSILGPSNPLIGSSGDELEFEYGGCRMFISQTFDYDEDEEDYYDWFRGACDNCHLKILRRYHAIRMPRPAGGWRNCYCSLKCLRDGICQLESYTGNSEDITRHMVDLLEPQFMEYGIQDRIPG